MLYGVAFGIEGARNPDEIQGVKREHNVNEYFEVSREAIARAYHTIRFHPSRIGPHSTLIGGVSFSLRTFHHSTKDLYRTLVIAHIDTDDKYLDELRKTLDEVCMLVLPHRSVERQTQPCPS